MRIGILAFCWTMTVSLLGIKGEIVFSESPYYDYSSFTTSEVEDSTEKQSIFSFLYQQKDRPHIIIETDSNRLLRTSSKKEYQPASISLLIKENDPIEMSGKIKARGFMRKKVCRIPPAKFNFSKESLLELGFSDLDKLKFVFPCKNSAFNQQSLYKEFFLYGAYGLIDSNNIRAALVDITMLNDGKETFNFTGFILEDEDNYANRKGARLIESGKVTSAVLDRDAFVKMIFFQYMIGNTDWALGNRHNIEIFKLDAENKIIALPYDFDFSGIVGQPYALPHESLPISNVNERHFFNYQMTDAEFVKGIQLYKYYEDQIMDLINAASFMSERSKGECKSFLDPFFKELEDPKRMLKAFRNLYSE